MKKFRTAIFNGYQKEEVDKYLNELMQEIEDLQEEVKKGQDAERVRRRMEEENRELSEQLRTQTEKLRKYESDYSGFMALMVNMKEQARQIVTDAQTDAEQVLNMAKKEADDIISTAQKTAEEITEQAQTEAKDYRNEVEKNLEKKEQEEIRKFEMARFKVAGYLDSLNRSQNRLLEVYEEFGHIVEQLPLRVGDVFSEEPFELLKEPGNEDAVPTE